MEDHHVDRPGVKAWQHVKLTGPNRSTDLQSHASPEAGIMRSSKPRKDAFTQNKTKDGRRTGDISSRTASVNPCSDNLVAMARGLHPTPFRTRP